MKKNLILVILSMTSISLLAQNSLVFSQQYEENQTYQSFAKIIWKSTVDYSADKQMQKKINSGASFPMTEIQEQKMYFTIHTTQKNSDGKIPFKSKLDSIFTARSINGQMQDDIGSSALDTSFRVIGHYMNGKCQIDSIVADKLSHSAESILTKSLNQMYAAINFPQKALRVGDSFENSVPLAIPTEDTSHQKLTSTIKYTLEKINAGFAVFNTSETMNVSNNSDTLKYSLIGRGTGTSIYNIAHHLMASIQMDMKVNSTIEAKSVQMTVNSETNSLYRIKEKE